MLLPILTGVLQHDESPAMQRMALAALRTDDSHSFQLLRQLAKVTELVPEARTFLAEHDETAVREMLWGRPDATAEQLAAALRGGERRSSVLETICMHAGVDALTTALTGARMNKPLANALTRAARWDLPKSLVTAALHKQVATNGYMDYHALYRNGVDLSDLVADETLSPVSRLAAAASPATSLGVVERHFTQIVLAAIAAARTPSEEGEFALGLLGLRKRQANSVSLREQYAALRQLVPFDITTVDAAWAEDLELSILAEQVDTVDFSAAAIGTPNDLRALWATMHTDAMRRAFALDFLEHRQCSADLFDDITAGGYGADADHVRVKEQLFWLQREGLFKAAARRDRNKMVQATVKTAPRDGARSKADLASWMTDVLLDDVFRAAGRPYAPAGLWGQLLGLEDYPRNRLGDLPGIVLYEVMRTDPDRYGWISKELASKLAPMALTDPDAAYSMLNNSMGSRAPFSGLVTATLVALRD